MYHCVGGSFSPPQNDAFGRVLPLQRVRAIHDLCYIFGANGSDFLHAYGVLSSAYDHSARESRSRSALVSNTHLILAQGYRWHGLPPVCRRPVSARLEPVRTSVQLSLVQVGVVPDDRNIQLERLNSGSQTIGGTEPCPASRNGTSHLVIMRRAAHHQLLNRSITGRGPPFIRPRAAAFMRPCASVTIPTAVPFATSPADYSNLACTLLQRQIVFDPNYGAPAHSMNDHLFDRSRHPSSPPSPTCVSEPHRAQDYPGFRRAAPKPRAGAKGSWTA